MPPLLDAHPTFGPQVIVVAPTPTADRFPAAFYDLARPVGNARREPLPVTTVRGRSVRGLIRVANLAARTMRGARAG